VDAYHSAPASLRVPGYVAARGPSASISGA